MKQPTSLRSISHSLSGLYSEERVLFGLGLLGIGLGIIGLIVMAVNGRIILPQGDIFKPVSFSAAIGIYVLTITLFIPFAGFSIHGRRWWRRGTVALGLYALGIENIQTYRGLDPRFARTGFLVDDIAKNIFGYVALGLIVMFLILAWRFFSKRHTIKSELLLLGIRYACITVICAFAAGLWMIANKGARIGATGNLLPLHAAGFHGLQAVPLVALLLSWSHVPLEISRRWVHTAGLAWLGAMAVMAWQTAMGRSVLEPSCMILLVSLLTFVWLLCAARAVISCGCDGLRRYLARSRASA
jgi:hypothetical protein